MEKDEVRLTPNGLNTDPGWALNRIGQEFSSTATYAFPDTVNPVRLYLIDTAVRNPESFVAANPNLTFEGTFPVVGSITTPRDHGTQLLSLIAGAETGIATGTPIHVVNYDIYPTSNSTSFASTVSAISAAVAHSMDPETVPMRSVICIATSSSMPANRYAIDDAIDMAIAAGIPVVISAGNLGADAANYSPPSNGSKKGVICVGASDENDLRTSESNYGSVVDVLAPGAGVRTRSESATSPLVAMNGTSPAAALVAGAVIVKLSTSPTFTPAGIESSLKQAAESSSSGFRVLRSIVAPSADYAQPDVIPDGQIISESALLPFTSADPSIVLSPSSTETGEAAKIIDSDEDGIPDITEMFYGASQSNTKPLLSVSADPKVSFKFPIDQGLLDGDITGSSFVLRNGSTWEIRYSTDYYDWSVPVGSLTKTTDAAGQAWLTANFATTTSAWCFVRIRIIAPPAQ